MLEISNIQVEESADSTVLSGDVGGQQLWYSFPAGLNIKPTPDAFLAGAFFVAMATGQDMHLQPGMVASRKLAANFAELQKVFGFWSKELKPFKFIGELGEAQVANPGVGAFFSGGIDSLHTMLMNQDEVTDLIYINGFDFTIESDVFQESAERLRKIVQKYGKNLITVETNHHRYMHHNRLGRKLNHGSCLASVAMALGFKKVLVPSSYSYKHLHPWGSHPLTDPLWSTEATNIVYDAGDADRSDKVARVIGEKKLEGDVLVCWQEPDFNCGSCGKCIRTMLTLKILEIPSQAFPREITTKEIRALRWVDVQSRYYIQDNYELAIKHGKHKIAKDLRYALGVSELKNFVRSFDEKMLGGSVNFVYRKVLRVPPTPEPTYLEL